MLDFPSSPSTGQQFTGPNGVVWVFDSQKWVAGTAAGAYAPVQSPAFTGNPTAPTPPVGDADTSIATTAFVAASTAGALTNVGRNLIHNPMFNIAQRGLGPWTASLSFTADRWQVFAANDVISVSVGILGDADRASIGDEAAAQALAYQFAGSATAGSRCTVFQQTEDVRRLGGKTVVLSFWAKGIVGTPKIGITLTQSFGTGGSPSAVVLTSLGATAALSTAWTRYTFTAALPSVAGKTLGTASDSKTGVNFYFSDQANGSISGIGVQSGTVGLWGVQLEIGSTATPLEKLDPVTQLQQCQRFYQTGYFSTGGGATSGGIGAPMAMPFPVSMRATPIITPSFTTQTNCGTSQVYGSVAAGNNGWGYTVYTAFTAAGGWALTGTFTASADL